MTATASTRYDKPVFKQGYRLTYVRRGDGEVLGVLVEGPRLPRALYIPRSPGPGFRVRLPEGLKKILRKEGFELE